MMPIVSSALSETLWERAYSMLGEVKIPWGEPLSTGLHFLIVIYIAALALRFLKKRSN
jgi:hypothetical protein